jgi:hypothetical protein
MPAENGARRMNFREADSSRFVIASNMRCSSSSPIEDHRQIRDYFRRRIVDLQLIIDEITRNADARN